MQWITRERPKIDRIACPWLIKRFIEKEPEFLYVPADKVLAVMKANKYGRDARIIGETTAEAAGQVGMRTAIGGIRVVDMPLGNIVPRIC